MDHSGTNDPTRDFTPLEQEILFAKQRQAPDSRQAVAMKAGRHPASARFHELLQQAGELHDKKQADYGKGNDPFANVRSSADFGVPAWVGAMVRLNDKVKRLQKVASGGSLVNEGVIDSFMDIAVYALIACVLFEENKLP